jgi:hypothetical protein
MLDDSMFAEAAFKLAELQRAVAAQEWQLMMRAAEFGWSPFGRVVPQPLPRIEMFPVAPQPR